MSYRIDCDRATVSKRYDCLAGLHPVFDRLFFQPPDFCAKFVDALKLRLGDRVVDVGCGPGINFRALHDAIGPTGQICGVDISPRTIVFGLFALPYPLEPDLALYQFAHAAHVALAIVMAALVALHVVAAIIHAIVWRDRTLTRMWWKPSQ